MQAKVDAEFQAVEDFLKHRSQDTTFLEGNSPSKADCQLIPKLYHAITVLGKFKDYSIAGRFPLTDKYVTGAFATAILKQTCYPPEFVIEGWLSKKASSNK